MKLGQMRMKKLLKLIDHSNFTNFNKKYELISYRSSIIIEKINSRKL